MPATINASLPPIQAPHLKPGDTIGLFAPAGPVRDEQAFSDGVRILRDYGFKIKMANDIMRSDDYLAGTEKRRAQEFHELWKDPQVKALLAVRGGYGSLRLFPHLDLDFIQHTPKILIGFSDISVLLNGLYAKTGLIGFHGPNLCSLGQLDKNSVDLFFNALTSQLQKSTSPPHLEILRPGTTKGFLLGGNLACITHMIGTPFEPSWHEAILFLEDINEAPYRVDRMLTQLALSGKLNRLNGIILGEFTQCGDIETTWERVLELTTEKNIPVWGNFPMGHGNINWTLPVGAKVEMNSEQRALRGEYLS